MNDFVYPAGGTTRGNFTYVNFFVGTSQSQEKPSQRGAGLEEVDVEARQVKNRTTAKGAHMLNKEYRVARLPASSRFEHLLLAPDEGSSSRRHDVSSVVVTTLFRVSRGVFGKWKWYSMLQFFTLLRLRCIGMEP